MTKRVKYTAIWKEWKINPHLRSPLYCSTIVTPKKALFDVISLLGDLVIAYRTNFVVIVPNAFRTFYVQCPVHVRVLAMFTKFFRGKGGGRFRATPYCFLTVALSVVFALLVVFIFTAIHRSYLRPLLIFNILWTLLIITLVIRSIFWISVAFSLFY